MWIYYVSLLIVLGLFIYGVITYSIKTGNRGLSQHFHWIKEHKIKIGALAGVLFIAVNLIFYIPIKKSLWCSYKGFEHSIETEYWVFSGNCNYLGKNGEWIPIWRLIGVAEGTDTDNTTHRTDTVSRP